MKRFKCSCGGKIFNIHTDDDYTKIENVQCRKCKKVYGTKVMSIDSGDMVQSG